MRYFWVAALNLALAIALSGLAPAEPKLNDRQAYDYVGRSPLTANCPFSIYCYRVLAPAIVHRLPLDADTSWRAYQVGANAAAGTILAAAVATLSPAAPAAALASVMAQTSYGFAFTAYDPYAADPLVFVIAAVLAWCWATDRVRLAVAVSAVGIFAKETVALIAGAIAIAALIDRRPGWPRWLLPAASSAIVLAAFHAASRIWLDWEIASNPAAQLSHGSWLGLWWRNNPLIERKAYMVFSTYGFAWVLALAGWRTAPKPWRTLAIATMPAMLFLLVIQTPERALGNAFFIVVPLAALLASRSPALGVAAVLINGLITAKAGTSSEWLPSARWTLVPAAIITALLLVRAWRTSTASRPSP